MSTALVPVHTNRTGLSIEDQGKLAQWAYKSGEFKALKSPAQAMMIMSYGRELGFGPATSLQLVYSVNGKPALLANTIGALIKQVRWQGTAKPRYDYRVREKSNTRCAIEFYERNDDGVMESRGIQEFTEEDAQQAGLTNGPNKANYQKYRRQMLFARCLTEGARTYAPDCLGGIVPYCPEELGYTERETSVSGEEIKALMDKADGVVVDAEYEPLSPPSSVKLSDTCITEEEYQELQELVVSKGRNLSNLLAQVGADPNDPRGMTRSQRDAIEKLLNNL